jgi:hypothetical protein
MISAMLAALLLLQIQQPPPVSVHMPTSEVVDVARMLAKDLGYQLDRYPKLYSFDLLSTGGGHAGYISIGFYASGHPIHYFDINETTGQVVDSMTCKAFDFPDLRVFQDTHQRLSGSRPRATEELMGDINCDRLTIVRNAEVPDPKSPATAQKSR